MRCLALLLTGLLGWLGQAHAQGMDVQLAPSAAVACMTPPAAQRGEPEYPFAPWKRGEGGRVLVELIFTAADREPKLKVIQQEGDESLLDSVEKHVASYRVPCLQAHETPLSLRMDFVFEPDKRKVTWSAPVDAADQDRRDQLKCMAANDGSKGPSYADWARRADLSGNVLGLLNFTAPDKPPEITVYAGSTEMRRLSREVVRWADTLRVPCLTQPTRAAITFMFRIEGTPAFGFRNISFVDFLRSVKGLQKQRATFDTQEMACPFDVKLRYYQPFLPNSVGQVDLPDSRRQPFLDWLSTLELDLRSQQIDAVLGDTATFTVPCIKIDLKPKE